MDEVKVSSPQYQTSSGPNQNNDVIGSRFRLDPGNPRNPDYHRSPFIQRVSDDSILGAIKEAQEKQRIAEKNLFKPSFVYESKAEPPIKSFIPKSFPSQVYVMAANGCATLYLKKKEGYGGDGPKNDPDSGNGSSAETTALENGHCNDNNKWNKQLPQHLKSLKFMIELLNDRHTNPEEFASASLYDVPAPFFGSKYQDLECLNDTWADPVFPYPGDRVFAPVNRKEVVVTERPPMYDPAATFDPTTTTTTKRRKGRGRKGRRRSKSGGSDYHCYRCVVDGLPEAELHNLHSSTGILGDSSNKHNLDKNGVLIVEEIADEFEEELLYPEELSPELAEGRKFGNISPISEDLSESDKETMNGSSSTANLSTDLNFSLISRLNCSSPILAHSPSLRNTPTYSTVFQDTPPSTGRRIRNIARILHDISDQDEEGHSIVVSSEEENTESFDLDLDDAEAGVACLSLSPSTKGLSKMAQKEDSVNTEKAGAAAADNDNKESSPQQDDELSARRTVWETLSANIEAHIGDGNPAGFISGPIDHPLQIPEPPTEVECPSYMYYNRPLAAIPKLS